MGIFKVLKVQKVSFLQKLFAKIRSTNYPKIRWNVQKTLIQMKLTKLSLGPFETRLAVKKAGIFLLVNKHDK